MQPTLLTTRGGPTKQTEAGARAWKHYCLLNR